MIRIIFGSPGCAKIDEIKNGRRDKKMGYIDIEITVGDLIMLLNDVWARRNSSTDDIITFRIDNDGNFLNVVDYKECR